MKLRADDDIYRFQAVFIDLRGWQLPFTARYIVWVAWGVVFVPTLFAVAVATPFNFIITLVVAVAISAAVTALFIAPHITAENTLEAVAFSALSEIRAGIEQANRVKMIRSQRPKTLGVDFFEEVSTETKPTWNPIRWVRKE